jgi:hypothetical protein
MRGMLKPDYGIIQKTSTQSVPGSISIPWEFTRNTECGDLPIPLESKICIITSYQVIQWHLKFSKPEDKYHRYLLFIVTDKKVIGEGVLNNSG